MPKRPNKLRRLARSIGIYTVILTVTLALFDIALISLGVLPPQYEYGDPDLGWSTLATQALPYDSCMDMTTNTRIDFFRNELGIRTDLTETDLRAARGKLIVAAVGDSHSDQCMSNSETHQGVLERQLVERGVDSLVLSNGVGRYSPLQAYLLFKKRLRQFDVDVLVMNLYTGNDFIDILRIDDRPYFVPDGPDYKIAEPAWMRYSDPNEVYRSRVAYIGREFADRIGIRETWFRLRMLSTTAGSQDKSVLKLVGYINDIRRSVEDSVGYSGSLSAQFLNQQLFLHHFPESKAEAIRRIDALMEIARSENPNLLLVMSPIPSYQVVTADADTDEALKVTLERLPITSDGSRRQEEDLYIQLKVLAAKHQWVFVDNLGALREYSGDRRLYNEFDYHVTRAASEVIGRLQAEVIAAALENRLD